VPRQHLSNLPSLGRDVGQFFGHLDEELAGLAALDLVECLDDADRAARLHEAENAFGVAVRLARRASPNRSSARECPR